MSSKSSLIFEIASFLADCTSTEHENFTPLFTGNEIIINESIPQDFDGIILCGSSVLDTLQAAANLFLLKIVTNAGASTTLPPLIFVTGGIGHSTSLLYDAVKQQFPEIAAQCFPYNVVVEESAATCSIPESHIIARILQVHFKIPQEFIIVEDQSTNCGANAELTVPLIFSNLVTASSLDNEEEKDQKLTPTMNKKKLILLQDPTLQLRSRLSFEKHLAAHRALFPQITIDIKSVCSPFLQESTVKSRSLPYSSARYESLVLGEIPRLRNDESGYGPKGKNFISAVVIPERIEEAFSLLLADADVVTSRQL